MAQPPFADYAYLLVPADPARKVVVVEADSDWRLDLSTSFGAAVVLWGRIPLRRPPAARLLLRHVLARERALKALRRRLPGLALKRIHRLNPPPGRPGRFQSRVRNYLLGGAVAELAAAHGVTSILEEVVRQSGVQPMEGSFAPGSDRAATLLARTADGEPAVLRLGATGGASNPAIALAALDRLAGAGIGRVPRVLGRGEVGEVSFVVESFIVGGRPKHIDDDLLKEVAGFLAGLPRGEGSPTAIDEDFQELARFIPSVAGALARLHERIRPLLRDLPSVMTHGDLWAGNIFVVDGSFSGVIDWDGAHSAGVPGTDLLHLFISRQNRRVRGDIGAAWQKRPWHSQDFAKVAAPYWRALDIELDGSSLDAVAAAWWASWSRRAIERHDYRLEDDRWMNDNVHSVLTAALDGDADASRG